MLTSRELYRFIPNIVKGNRKSQGLSQDQLARKVGISQGYFSKLELGRSEIKLKDFLNICKALDLDPSEIIKKIEVRQLKLF